ncbi:MAG TPA: response regulator [Burkholderiales bacterium]|jgi:CheY-like chemotaxis protein|nr:response regulator [Burkholderiales bacterium]
MILIVDDQTMTATLAQVMLARYGIGSTLKHSGVEALYWLERHKVRVVLCDISMPGMDGTELAREIRARWGKDRPRLVAYSAYPPPDGEEGLREAGFDDYLKKPAGAETLATAVKRWLYTEGYATSGEQSFGGYAQHPIYEWI